VPCMARVPKARRGRKAKEAVRRGLVKRQWEPMRGPDLNKVKH